MKSLGARAQGLRLERMHASPLWTGAGFRNLHPVLPGLRDATAERPTLSEFICHAGRRVPQGPLPSHDPRQAWLSAAQSGLRVGAFHPSWGDIHLGPENALKALQLLTANGPAPAFLPVHWGTFSLALHDWDAPAETLFALAPQQGARLLMPRLGEAVEPANADGVTPWWRGVDQGERARGRRASAEPAAADITDITDITDTAGTAAKARAVPWPLD